MDKKTLLIVEDDEAALKTLARYLEKENYDIKTAESIDSAFMILQSETVDIIISDYMMPGMNGIDFLRIAKESWPCSARILMSGYIDINMIIDSFNTDIICRFIPKPWAGYDIKKMIGSSLSRRSD